MSAMILGARKPARSFRGLVKGRAAALRSLHCGGETGQGRRAASLRPGVSKMSIDRTVTRRRLRVQKALSSIEVCGR